MGLSLYDQAKDLLLKEFQKALEHVKEDPYYRAYAEEKYTHSLQVSGVGNGIIKNEPFFQKQTPEFLSICRVAILLHDICRFHEIVGLFKTGKKTDHGVAGSEFLKKTDLFDNILITLPIKHHGHVIEDLYDDSEYKNLDKNTQNMVKYICFAVRDADKIANWYPLCISGKRFDFWFSNKNKPGEKKITDIVWNRFCQKKVIIKKDMITSADNAIETFGWLFDINYSYSIKYCRRLKLFEKMPNVLGKLKIDESYIAFFSKTIQDYLQQKFPII